MSASGIRTLVALALQLTALVALCLAMFGTSWLDSRSKPRVLALIDRSESVPRAAVDQAVAQIRHAAGKGGVQLQWLEFAGTPSAPSPQIADTTTQLGPSTTNIEAALEVALLAHAQSALAGMVVISDGHENVGDATRALRAARQAELPVSWLAVERVPPPTRIKDILVPDHALAGRRIQMTVQLAGQIDRPLRIKATARTLGGQAQVVSHESANAGRSVLELEASHHGAMRIDVALEDPVTEATIDIVTDAAVIDVAPPAAILYAQGSVGSMAQSLARGGWMLNIVSAAQLDVHADALASYQAVVLDDIAIADASPRFWRLLVDAVKNRGLGLMVLGGERSFALGGYRGSVLESVLPVLSEPAALDQTAAVVFAVDKSGSMGEGSAGVERFQLAQRAVIETARGLTQRDSLGLVVFDVVPRVLVPVGPASTGTTVLERDWQTRPGGGTKLALGVDAAINELERSGATRRILILVTDGFIDRASLTELRERLDRNRIETIALAVGPDADVSALERIVAPHAGVVLRVDQAAELPLAMRTWLERRRARQERGTIDVVQQQALPFVAGSFALWPPVAAYSVTRSRPEATLAVLSAKGDPLIAFHHTGLGRVVAVTPGFGASVPQWLQWHEWPRLAGGLADWISGAPAGEGIAWSISSLPAGLLIDADVQALSAGADRHTHAITVDTPTAKLRALSLDTVAPGRLRATLPDDGPGLYTFLIAGPRGTQRQLHLRRPRAESRQWGTGAALDVWKGAGLIGSWEPGFGALRPGGPGDHRPIDRALVGLGFILFLAGILMDRTNLKRPAFLGSLRRWRMANDGGAAAPRRRI